MQKNKIEKKIKEDVQNDGSACGGDRGFTELQDFIHVPQKNYFSGMIARLVFSIATIIKADILIVGEVLVVSEFRFQENCKAKIAELLESGTTLLFVSHSAEQVKQLCKKAIWLDHGNLMVYGDTKEVYTMYEKKYNQ